MKLNTLSKYWAIEPDSFAQLQSLNLKEGIPLNNTRTVTVRDNVAIIPVYGVITARYDFLTYMLGGTALDILAKDIQTAVDAPNIKAIVLDIDSPGGVAVGPAEISELIFKARSKKEIIAYAGRNCCSAAYWIASACSRIIAHSSAFLGSIGVVTTLPVQEAPDQDGYRNIEITSSNAKNKRPNPTTPEGLAEIKKELDALESRFISDISKNRNLSAKTIQEDFGLGGVLIGSKAFDKKMVDGLSSFEELLESLTTTEKETNMAENKENMASLDIENIKAEAFEKGKQEGISQENSRILALESIDTLGYDDLLVKAKADPQMTAEKLSLQILSREKEEGSRYLQSLKRNEEKLPKVASSVEDVQTKAMTLEEQAKANWNKPEIQAEFGSCDAYFAYLQANKEGLIKLYSNNKEHKDD